MPRFFVDHPLALESAFNLPETVARHVQVLRMQPGESITLFNGQGGEYSARISLMGKREVGVLVTEHQPIERESAIHSILLQAVSANERMDFTVQKATEVGVTEIWPFYSQYSQQRLSGERAERRLAHWQSIAQAACEQSGRTRVPQIRAVGTLESVLRDLPADLLKLTLAPGAVTRLRDLTTPVTHAAVLVGPEGGLTGAEEMTAQQAGFVGIHLGPRILRTETAGQAVLAVLQSQWGDW
ncbi:16S rRNA (uracil(1498)-N(3))-methyltransferase [Silvimonas sp. JCM 19000]